MAVATAAAATVLFVRRCRRRQRLAAGLRRGKVGMEGAGATASIDLIQRQQRDFSISSMLRVRFGGLEGLEIGGLIGRGAFGR